MSVLLIAAVHIGGCAPTGPQRAAPAQPAAIGPCVDRLHDLGGVLLLYWNQHRRLPPARAELETAAREAGIPLLCPVSGKPYVYDPDGVPDSGAVKGVVLCDGEPCHSGGRWGIVVSPPAAGGAIISRVVFLPPAGR